MPPPSQSCRNLRARMCCTTSGVQYGVGVTTHLPRLSSGSRDHACALGARYGVPQVSAVFAKPWCWMDQPEASCAEPLHVTEGVWVLAIRPLKNSEQRNCILDMFPWPGQGGDEARLQPAVVQTRKGRAGRRYRGARLHRGAVSVQRGSRRQTPRFQIREIPRTAQVPLVPPSWVHWCPSPEDTLKS